MEDASALSAIEVTPAMIVAGHEALDAVLDVTDSIVPIVIREHLATLIAEKITASLTGNCPFCSGFRLAPRNK